MPRTATLVWLSFLSIVALGLLTLAGCEARVAARGNHDTLHEKEGAWAKKDNVSVVPPAAAATPGAVQPSDFFDFTTGGLRRSEAEASTSAGVNLSSPVSVVGTPQESLGIGGPADAPNFDLSEVLLRAGQPNQQPGYISVPTVLAPLITERTDELWIIPRFSKTTRINVRPCGTGTIVVFDPNAPADSWPTWPHLPAVSTGVHAEITGQLAAVKVEQSFTNSNDHAIEAAYAFPLPDDAAVSDFVMSIGDRHIRGIVREREEAKQIYDAAKAQGMNAALLEHDRPNIFLQRVANIAPGATIGVEITYYNTLACSEGWCELVLPTTIGPRFTPAGQPAPVQNAAGQTARVTIGVDIDAGVELGKVECESHKVEIVRPSRTQAFARLSAEHARSDRDLVLRWNIGQEKATGAVYTTTDSRGGYFAMQLVPPSNSRRLDPRPVDIVFVLDRSGSMQGWPIEIAKNTIIRGIDSLGSDERFQIVDFSESTSGLGTKMLPPTRENRAAAKRYLEGTPAQGGTQMRAGLDAALAIPNDAGRRKVIAFLTDGFIGNESEVLAQVHKGLGDACIFSFGIGGNPNRFLINELAALGRGVSAYALTQSDSAPALEAFIETVRRPALTDIRVSFGGEGTRIEDASIPAELFAGRNVFITGRFVGSMSSTVLVTARANGQPISFEVPVKSVGAGAGAILPKLWARDQITQLARRQLRGEQIDAVAASRTLAIEYGLASQFTSFVAVDSMSGSPVAEMAK